MYAEGFQKLSKIVKLQESNPFKKLNKQEQAERLKQEFYNYAKPIECEKLFYFGLTYKQTTLIVTASSDNAEQKRFLGYDWSNRKGSEGIQIHTPGGMLYNEHDRNAAGTIAAAIRNRFSAAPAFHLDKDKQHYCTLAHLSDMIDFSRLNFNKAIKLTPDKKIEISSKYPLELLSSMVPVIETGSRPSGGVGLLSDGVLSLGGEHIDNKNGRLDMSAPKYVPFAFYNQATRGKLQQNDLLICKDGALSGKVAIVRDELMNKQAMINEHVFLLRCNNLTTQFYLFEFLYSPTGQKLLRANLTGAAQGGLNKTNLENIKIPSPPIPIQEKIVAECKKIDEEYNTSRMSIEEYKKKIAQVFERLEVITNVGGGVTLKLSNTAVFDISIGKRVLNSEVSPQYTIPVYSANVFEPFGMIDKLLIEDFSKPSVLWGIDGDWMVNIVDAGIPFYPTDHCGVLRIKTDDILPNYMAYLLEKEGKKVGFSRTYRASIDRIESLSVQAAPIEEQRKAIKEIETYESEIAAAKEVMAACTEKKKMILDKWL